MARTKKGKARPLAADPGLHSSVGTEPMNVDGFLRDENDGGGTSPADPGMDAVTVTLADNGGVMGGESSVKVTVYAVDFPGYVSSSDAAATSALRTVGGLSGLQDQRVAHPKQLKVKLRPEDPYCHPVMGTAKRSTGLMLLKLACQDGVDGEGGEGGEGGNGQRCRPLILEEGSSAVMVDEVYGFKQPADLQLDSVTEMSKVSNESGDVVEEGVPSAMPQPYQYGYGGYGRYGQYNRLSQAVTTEKCNVACVPPVFLVEGSVEYGVDTYGAGREHGVPSYLAVRGDNEVIVDYGVTNLSQLVRDDGVYYESSFKDTDLRLSPVGHALRKIFLERPVYLVGPLAKMVSSKMMDPVFSDADANEQLGKLCYRFSSGPWRGCWVRKGYDPRKDSQAAKYQVVTLVKGGSVGGADSARSNGLENDTGWTNVDEYEALCKLDASRITQYPARIQVVDIQDDDVRTRLKQGPGKQCGRKIGWQTEFEMEKLCERIGKVLRDTSIHVCDSETGDLRLMPFSTIRSFGTNLAPFPSMPTKRCDNVETASQGDGSQDRRLFDILPAEYHSAIKKLGLTQTAKK